MPQKTSISSSYKTRPIIITIIGGIGMLLLAIYFLRISMISLYPQLIGIILGLLFGSISVYCFYALLKLEKLELSDEKLIIKTLIETHKKTIYLKDITYYEIHKTPKIRQEELTIFTASDSYKLASSNFQNYTDLKAILAKDKTLRTTEKKEIDLRKFAKYLGLGLILLSSFILYKLQAKHKELQTIIKIEDLIFIEVTVRDKFQIKESKNARKITIPTNEYPHLIFEFPRNNFTNNENKAFVAEIKQNDLLEMAILKTEYDKKIKQTLPLTFWEKTVNFPFIYVYGIRSVKYEKEFLSIASLNARRTKEATSTSFWGFIVFMALLFCIGSFLVLISSTSKMWNRFPPKNDHHV